MADLRNGALGAHDGSSSPDRVSQRRLSKRVTAFGFRATVLVLAAVASLHVAVLMATTMAPPILPRRAPSETSAWCPGPVCWQDQSWVDRRKPVVLAQLADLPAAIGRAHASLLHDEMEQDESALWSVFRTRIPSLAGRTLVLDLARLRFRGLDQRIPYARRLEIAAAADAFSPDPFATEVPTYQRFLYLNSLYDVALSFEGSALVGCTSIAFAPSGAQDAFLARNFDFETHDEFDEGKALLLFREQGQLPVLSVAWPGLVGVVTGMNSEGVGIVVHGARAGRSSRFGEPVPITVREALSVAHTADEAVAFISRRPAMVSHMLLIADASGRIAVMERVPGQAAFVRYGEQSLVLTNHLEGPEAGSEANAKVRAVTSTLARRARGDELVSQTPRPVTPASLAAMLRDDRAVGGAPLPVGDRRAINAGIATHGVIMDLSARRLWVSEGPHLEGRFLGFSLASMLRGPHGVREEAARDALPAPALAR